MNYIYDLLSLFELLVALLPLGVLLVCITICSGLDVIGSSDFYLDIFPHPSLLVFIAADAAIDGTQC